MKLWILYFKTLLDSEGNYNNLFFWSKEEALDFANKENSFNEKNIYRSGRYTAIQQIELNRDWVLYNNMKYHYHNEWINMMNRAIKDKNSMISFGEKISI